MVAIRHLATGVEVQMYLAGQINCKSHCRFSNQRLVFEKQVPDFDKLISMFA